MADVVEELFSFGMWVRRRRKALDLTQAALAQRVGCAEVTIRKLEADVFRPSHEIAERLAICLDIPPDDRAVFLQVARGEHSVDRLRTPNIHIDISPPRMIRGDVQVEQIPLDSIPTPAPLPSGSRMPLSRNPLFVGRDNELRALAKVLKAGETAAIGQIAAATGLGGIGKTQLACEFVHRYGQFFNGGVLWLSFADPAAVPAEVAACGGVDGMQLSPEFGTLPLDEQVRRVLTAWESPIPRLLVFDNCEDEALFDAWQPKYGGCRILITSRRQHWDPALGVHPLSLPVLPRGESLALLRTFRPDVPAADADLNAIAEALGDLPLALHLAGSFLAKYRRVITPADYLRRLRAPTILDDRSLREAGISPTKHLQHVARTFEQSYERLDPMDAGDALALKLLACAACFAPGEPIPRWLLLQTLSLADDPDAALLAEDALTRLIDLGLLETDDADALRLHRLLVAFVRAIASDPAAQAAVEATMLRVADTLNKTRNPRPLLALELHLRFITDAAQQREDERTAGLYNALGDHLQMLGAYPEAQGYFQGALEIQQRVLGMEHPDTAWSLHNLGEVLYAQGEYAGARQYHEQALEIQQRVLGMEHPDTAWSLHNLGGVLRAQGEYAGARQYHEQALAIQERVLGMEHPDTARSLNSLGGVLWVQGEYAGARHYLERALAIREQVLGIEHPDTARSLNSLGGVLWAQGQYAEAQGYLEQALAIRQQVLGTDHPLTAHSLNNLGLAVWMQGEYAGAWHYHEQALVIRKHVLGMEHPDTAWSLNNLGGVLWAQGQYTRARQYHEQALAIQERVLGTEHPNTAWSLNNLGVVLQDQGDLVGAKMYMERALAIWERVLGMTHPSTANGLDNLGRVLRAQGDLAGARQYHEQALTIRKQLLGMEHPDTARSLSHLGLVLLTQGEYTAARSYLEHALTIFEQRLGVNHPKTQTTRNTLATLDAPGGTIDRGA